MSEVKAQTRKNTSKRKKRNAAVSILLIIALITGIFAFLSAQDSKTNVFTTGRIDIELKETVQGTTYDKSSGDTVDIPEMFPMDEIEKKPWIANTGDNDAYVFMYVAVPIVQGAILEDAAANRLNNGNPVLAEEMFTMLNENGEEGVNDGWFLLDGPIMGTSEAGVNDSSFYNYYVYGYTKALAPNEETPALFNDVRVINYVDDTGIKDKYKMPIKAYAIQTDLINVEEVRKNITTSDTLTEEEMSSIWSDCATVQKVAYPGEFKFAGTRYKKFKDDMPVLSSVTGTPIVYTYDDIVNNEGADTYLYGEAGEGDEYYKESGHEDTWEHYYGTYVPSNTTSIAPLAFFGTTLQSAIVPENVTDIKIGAFYGCISLESVALPSSLTEIKSYLFDGCVSLENIAFPNNITFIGQEAFLGCISLKEVIIPDSVTTIGPQAFDGCYGVKKLKLPNNLQEINKQSLGMPNLEEVEYKDVVYRVSDYADRNDFKNAILNAFETNNVRGVSPVVFDVSSMAQQVYNFYK